MERGQRRRDFLRIADLVHQPRQRTGLPSSQRGGVGGFVNWSINIEGGGKKGGASNN